MEFKEGEIVCIKPKSYIWCQYVYRKGSDLWITHFDKTSEKIEEMIKKEDKENNVYHLFNNEPLPYKNVNEFYGKILLSGKMRFLIKNLKTKEVFMMSNEHDEIVKIKTGGIEKC